MGTPLADWSVKPARRNLKIRRRDLPQQQIGYLRLAESRSPLANPGPTAPVHNRAAEYVNRQIARLVRDEGLPGTTAARAREMLIRAMKSDDLLPYLAVDEDELHAHWIAGHASLELSIPAAGDIYVRTTDDAGAETLVEFAPRVPISTLQSVIRHLTQTVEMGNPRWRRLFA